MKYRCPHCHHIFEDLQKSQCPNCKKGLRHPEKWKKLKLEKNRREGIQQRLPASHELRKPIWMIFMSHPRLAVWVLGGCILVGGVVLSSNKTVTVPYQPPTKMAQTRKELTVIHTAMEWFRVHCKRYPTTGEGLKALVQNPGVPGWQGYYLESLPPDLWGHPFQYSNTSDVIWLSSMGPDGKPGTPDDILAPPADYKALMKRLAKDKQAGDAHY